MSLPIFTEWCKNDNVKKKKTELYFSLMRLVEKSTVFCWTIGKFDDELV
jgi:hypothetical protein